LEGAEFVKIFGEELEVKARIERMTSLSAHADQAEIMHWLRGFKHPPKTTFIVHGEPEPRQILAQKVRDELGWNVETPLHHQRFPLG
jgi:metallo-beta-lactamase family protein